MILLDFVLVWFGYFNFGNRILLGALTHSTLGPELDF